MVSCHKVTCLALNNSCEFLGMCVSDLFKQLPDLRSGTTGPHSSETLAQQKFASDFINFWEIPNYFIRKTHSKTTLEIPKKERKPVIHLV